jgi:hypothetical protein
MSCLIQRVLRENEMSLGNPSHSRNIAYSPSSCTLDSGPTVKFVGKEIHTRSDDTLPYLYISSPCVCRPLLDISVVSLWFSRGRMPNAFKLAARPRWFQIIISLELSTF